MRLARKLTFSLLAAIVAVFALDSYLNTRLYEQLYLNDLKRDHRVLARALTRGVVAALRDHGEEYALQLVEEANAREAAIRIRWVNFGAAPGDPRAPEAPAERILDARRQDPFVDLILEGEAGQRFYTYAFLPVEGAHYAIEFSDPLLDSRSYFGSRRRVKLMSVLAMVTVCGLLAWFAGIRLVGRPTQLLVEKARRIGAGDFSQPLALQARDELSDLADEMNAMAAQLESARGRVAAETTARLEALEQLRHADRLTTVGKLAAGIAHELGTPLNVVAGRAKMIANGEISKGRETRETARVIADQAARMTAIVRQLLDFARRQRSEKRPVDLGRLLRETATLLSPLAERHRVRLELCGPEDPLVANVDPDQVHQAVANLVVNAIQASPAGSRVAIGIQAGFETPPPVVEGRPGPHVHISVEDEGTGIPPEHLSHIFDPFFTTKDVGEGTGLGLCVSFGIVREHGGWIGVESRPDQGSRFSVYLPQEPRDG